MSIALDLDELFDLCTEKLLMIGYLFRGSYIMNWILPVGYVRELLSFFYHALVHSSDYGHTYPDKFQMIAFLSQRNE